ncbi:MAG: riboflavin biosynthesis protein RibF [Bacteroidales bacterium]|nr:riboflavin biosynthesis protein RibF [Bacteroidales bacterium]
MRVFDDILAGIPSKCIATVGVFDGVHLGHRYIIKQVMNQADALGVEELVVTMNPHPAEFFGKKIELLSDIDEKLAMLEEIGVRNVLVLPFDGQVSKLTAAEFVNNILVDKMSVSKLVLGYNNSIGHRVDGKTDIELSSIPVERLQKFSTENDADISSSEIRKLLSHGRVGDANRCLGYEYSIKGVVVQGFGIGRTIGFPTANIELADARKMLPANGVYVAEACIQGKMLSAMLNIGTRPTFDGENRTVELHIVGFDGDIYGEEIRVFFKGKIRDEQRFPNVEGLVAQLVKDREVVKKFFGYAGI